MKPLALLVVTFVCLATSTARSQIPNFPAADRVLGASDFITVGPATASASSLKTASGVSVDPVSGKVFVSSPSDNRILRFANSAALANGASAEAVIGQPDYTTITSGLSNAKLNTPYGIHVDGSGRLWVAEYSNNRVVMYANAAALPEFGATASLVLGQPDFATGTPGTTAAKMGGPSGVFVDAADNLWVAEYSNNRVVKFANASSLSNGASANSVLGQVNFNLNATGTSATTMEGPVAVLVDGAGRLWVAEQVNNRVLRFDNAAALGNGTTANAVLGQPGFVTNTEASTAAGLDEPNAFALDAAGTLYVTDYGNNRVVFFKNPAAKANGGAANGVIGQPDFTTATFGTTARTLHGPYGGLDFDAAGRLWVTDFINNRALRFSPDTTSASPSVKGKVPKSTTAGKVTIQGTATDSSGVASVRFRVGKGAFKAASGTTSWKLTAKLKPGKNTIEIVAVDSAGNTSPAKKVKVTRQ